MNVEDDDMLEEILTHCDYTMKRAFEILDQLRRSNRSAARALEK